MTNGILTVYKEKGFTSHDVVAKVRRIFGQKKVGHTGTLDPQATGVLPVCLGPSTKVCGLLTDQDKTYEAVMQLGIRTDTQDLTGTVLERHDILPQPEEISCAVMRFLGDYEQVPPMYSARKVNGRKLYELAREGTVVERTARTVHISEIAVIRMEPPYVSIRVTCSKGTYIRTLCDDIGQMLGCGAAMAELLRTRVGPFALADSAALSVLEAAKEAGTLERYVLPPDRLFTEYRAVSFTQEAVSAARNGNFIPFSRTGETGTPTDGMRVRMYDPDAHFYGIYEADPAGGFYRPVRILTELN